MAKKKNRTLPTVGAKFQHRYHGDLFEMTVVKTSSGLGYKVGEVVYASPTAAAKSIVDPM